MLPPNPAMFAAAKKVRIASIFTSIFFIGFIAFLIAALNTCNALCTDLYYFYECHTNNDLYCCSSTYCSGSCRLINTSCNGLTIAAYIFGFFFLISIIASCVFGFRLRSMQEKALMNGNMIVAYDSNGNLIVPNQQYPQYYNNNNPVIYGNNQPNQPYPGNPYQQGGNYVAPQYYNNNQQ